MSTYEIEKELDKLYHELEIAENCDEKTACKIFNADSKSDFISVIMEEIFFYDTLLQSETQLIS